MKKIYLLMLSAALCGFNASAQCVIDQNNNTIGETPDDLGTFCQDVEINEELQVAVPNDTTVFGFSFDFDSIFVEANSIPAGLAFDCPHGCTIYANGADLSRNCLDLTGMPTTPSEGGIDTIDILATVYGTTPLGDPFEYTYPFEIEISVLPTEDAICTPTGLENFEIGSALSVYPNPTKGNAYVNLDMPATSDVNIELYDVIFRI